MNYQQKWGFFILILISVLYVYFSFFGNGFKFPEFNKNTDSHQEYNPLTESNVEDADQNKDKNGIKTVKIFILDKSGKIRSINRICDLSTEKSCFAYAINELLLAPSKWEKSKGFTSEIPQGTKLLSLRESSDSILIDLSSDFESGGGAESTYMRIKQLIKTANANSSVPTYLYINGKQVNVVGGEGVMLKQPLNERSLDE